MKEVWNIIMQNINCILAAMIILLMIMVCVGIHMVKRTNRMIREIKCGVEKYLKVILEDVQEEEVPDMMPLQETQMRQSIEHKRKQQEEAVFNAVLQEIFP